MLEFGCTDASVSDAQCAAWLGEIQAVTRVRYADMDVGPDKPVRRPMPAAAQGQMSIADVQRGLTAIGAFPGGRADGIFGFRTRSAVRLFQEYVRTIEAQGDVLPNGRFDQITQVHLQRWLKAGRKLDWGGNPGEHASWLAFLERVKAHRIANPGPFLDKVNAFAVSSDTLKPAQWDFSTPGAIHLIGVRREEFTGFFDDIFVLLIDGMVFKFQGSTEPGKAPNVNGRPFLAPGQHAYHFGMHKSQYLALRPVGAMRAGGGVLIVRSSDEGALNPADLARPLETNGTINIHWASIGAEQSLNYRRRDGTERGWSEGCQVITGAFYINPANQLIDCRHFAARNDSDIAAGKTRAAYNVVQDLVTAASGGLASDVVRYMLLEQSDIDLAPEMHQSLQSARDRVYQAVGGRA